MDCLGKLKKDATVTVTVVNSVEEFLPYLDSMTTHYPLLGATLGIDDYAQALAYSSEPPKSKCLSVLRQWLQITPGATWTMFCEKLGNVEEFNSLREKIRLEKCMT